MDAHHPADYGRDETTACICANCHRIVSDDQKDHPPFDPNADPALDRIDHFLIGFADMLRIIIEKLYEFGLLLIDMAMRRVEMRGALVHYEDFGLPIERPREQYAPLLPTRKCRSHITDKGFILHWHACDVFVD